MSRRGLGCALAAISLIVIAAGCSTPSTVRDTTTAGTATASADPTWNPAPPAGAAFDYQIGGAYPPDPAVRVVDRDRTATADRGRYSVCYVNAFQTQPADDADWTRQHADLLLRAADGRLVSDPQWPGEYLLDTATAAKRAALRAIVEHMIDDCVSHGFQAVEADNLDSFTRSGGRLTAADNEAFAGDLIRYSHAHGLAIGQKNAADRATQGRALGFDFAVAEECQVYDECAAYLSAYGDHVIEIEYTDNGQQAFRDACRLRGRQISVILRDRQVTPRGDPAYRYERCA